MNINHLFKFIIILGIVCALVFGGVFVYLKTQKEKTSVSTSIKSPPANIVEKEDWVKDLPTGLFGVSDSQDVDSAFSSVVAGSYNTKSARYLSTKDFNKTKQFFIDYFAKNSWTKLAESPMDSKDYVSFTYKKEDTTVIITVNNKPDSTVVVNINIKTKI